MEKDFYLFELGYKSDYGNSIIWLYDFKNNTYHLGKRISSRVNCYVYDDIILKLVNFTFKDFYNDKSSLKFSYDNTTKALLIDEIELLKNDLEFGFSDLDCNTYDEHKYAIKYRNFNNNLSVNNIKYDKVQNVVFVINQYDISILVYEFNENMNIDMDYDAFWDAYQNDDYITKYTFISKTENLMYCKIFDIIVPCNDWGVSHNNFVMTKNETVIDDKILWEYKIYLNDILYIHLILDKRIYFLEGLEGYYEVVPNERDRTYDWKMMKLKDTKAYKNYLKYGKK